MAEAFAGMAISGVILLVVVVFTVLISIAAVNRGEQNMHHDSGHDKEHKKHS